MQPNFAEALSVLRELLRVNFTPRSVLDYGSGSCSVFWAANELWGNKVEQYQCVDPSDEMNKFAMDVLRVWIYLEGIFLVLKIALPCF